jgi:peptide chain release factor 1
MFSRLKQCAARYQELEAQLSDPDLHSRPGRMAAVVREMGALKDKAAVYGRWTDLEDRADKAREMIADESDPELIELAREELSEVDAALQVMNAELRQQIVDDEPNRGRDVLLEIRAGAGGDEASLFVADLLKIYTRFIESHGLKMEVLTSHPTDVGGLKEITLSVSGDKAWDLFSYEAGGHRVQRVPETEAQGRIHTSAVTVAVLAEVDEVDVDIQEGDLRIDTYRASGPGGQNVNKTSSAVRITHLPTDTVVQCQDESSQHKNKARAMRMLRARLHDAQQQAVKDEQDTARRSQIGSGDRSERIRTYNYPQNRVTDHRIKTNYSLETVLVGKLDSVVEDLRTRDMELKLAALGEGAPDS